MHMGKYSLEHFEKYPTARLRPVENEAAARGPEDFRFQTVRLSLEEAYSLPSSPVFLIIIIERKNDLGMAWVESSLQALAARLYRNEQVLGVTLDARMEAPAAQRLWETAARAFAPKRYYVPVTDGAQMDYMLKRGLMRGLYVRVDGSVYDVCEAFAENLAQRLYKQMPVLVSFAGMGEARFAVGWHAQAVENATAEAGWAIALRRLMLPTAISAGGYAPLRFWWTNRGPALCHEKLETRLRLAANGIAAPIPLSDRPACIPLGDRVDNEIARVPQVAPGVYRLEFGLFLETGKALRLAHAGATEDGYYCAGEVTVDTVPRPEYETIWEDYFPDGYYPLEDPPVPGTR